MARWDISLKSLGLAAVFAVAASVAQAVTFTVDAANSSVLLTKTSGLGDPISASLNAGLATTSFDLANPGDSETFDFLDFVVTGGFGLTAYDITATLAFNPPSIAATGGGSAGALVLFGTIVGGNLTWNSGVPATLAFGNGGLATVDFQGGTGFFLGGSETTTATVTLDVAPVPLPASALLLLTGLGGIAFARRRRMQS